MVHFKNVDISEDGYLFTPSMIQVTEEFRFMPPGHLCKSRDLEPLAKASASHFSKLSAKTKQ